MTEALEAINGILWHDRVLLTLLGAGLLFTVWSGCAQFRALTHGVVLLTGRYDDARAPGAISHFQALSAALSATVGLGNIAGVAIAISIGGPGAVFWMWVAGALGMALKLTEVTQAMLYRDLSDPGDPHGGAMWVVRHGLARYGPFWGSVGKTVGGIFCITLLISAVTGGNMFQAWNVAEITREYFGVPMMATGVVLTILVGLVILGGIRRIGAVAGRLVPAMCGLYVLAGLAVIVARIEEVPEMLRLIVNGAFRPSEAAGAFLGGTAGWAFVRGMQRALFSNEAGQGSAPIAHAAARTSEPAREGMVACLEPFVDTICVCSITAIVILLTGVWSRGPETRFMTPPEVVAVEPGSWTLAPTGLGGRDRGSWRAGDQVFTVVAGSMDPRRGVRERRLHGTVSLRAGSPRVEWENLASPVPIVVAADGVYGDYKGATLTAKAFDDFLPGLGLLLVPAVSWLFALSTIISWSYYGEQGMVYLLGKRSVMAYRVVYCLLILVASSPLLRTEAQLDLISTLGTGVMLVANLPIMLFFAPQAMATYRSYIARLRAGEFRAS